MTRLENHLQEIKSRITAYFDCEGEKNLGDYFWDLVAVSHRNTQRYFLQKHWVIDDYRISEIHLYKIIPGKVSNKEWKRFKEGFQRAISAMVKPGIQQMETLIYGIIISERLPDERIAREIRRFQERKNFLLGLKGWSIARTALVALDENQVIIRRSLKQLKNLIK